MPESYKHLYAKQLLAQWLRDKSSLVKVHSDNDHKMISFDQIKALVPIDDIFGGVYEEYPICSVNGKTTLHYPFEVSEIPTYDQLLQKAIFILDIAVRHMDKIKYGIEIVHTNPVSKTKITALQLSTADIGFELYHISADWILNQCSVPYKLELMRLIPGDRWTLPFATMKGAFSSTKLAVPTVMLASVKVPSVPSYLLK